MGTVPGARDGRGTVSRERAASRDAAVEDRATSSREGRLGSSRVRGRRQRAAAAKAAADAEQARVAKETDEARRLGRDFAKRARNAGHGLVTVHLVLGEKKHWWYAHSYVSEKRQAWDAGAFDLGNPRLYPGRRLFVGEEGDLWVGYPRRPMPWNPGGGKDAPYVPTGGVEPIGVTDANREQIANVLASAFL